MPAFTDLSSSPDESQRNQIVLNPCVLCGLLGFVRRHGFLKDQSGTVIRGWRFLF